LRIKGPNKLSPVDIKTLVYPGFPTDLQQPLTSLLTLAEGTSIINDTIYQARVKHIDELRRMNARIKIENGSVIISGPAELEGALVKASDLRAGAALVIAGLIAKGTTIVTGVDHIERGYENMTEKLVQLGANIRKEKMTEREMEQLNVQMNLSEKIKRIKGEKTIERSLTMELVRVTEAAALSSARWKGRGLKNEADDAATTSMRTVFDTIPMRGTVVIGEGEMDEAPMLYIGEKLGTGSGPLVDVAVDPLEGT